MSGLWGKDQSPPLKGEEVNVKDGIMEKHFGHLLINVE